MTNELQSLKSKYNALCQRFEPSSGGYYFLTERHDDGSPHVEYDGREYHYIVTERGLDLEQRSTADPDEILYWLVNDITFWKGVAYELKHRVDGPDVRRLIFAHSLELMKKADQAMAVRLEMDIAAILAENPFIDQAV
ncbi:immunity 63 family protein [soil metagenome]